MQKIFLLEDLNGTGKQEKLFFSRYLNNNPALFRVDDENKVSELSIDLFQFYCDYPFGEYSLIVLKDDIVAENLFESGIVYKPVFHVNGDGYTFTVCEMSDQVIDLLKEEGRFYV